MWLNLPNKRYTPTHSHQIWNQIIKFICFWKINKCSYTHKTFFLEEHELISLVFINDTEGNKKLFSLPSLFNQSQKELIIWLLVFTVTSEFFFKCKTKKNWLECSHHQRKEKKFIIYRKKECFFNTFQNPASFVPDCFHKKGLDRL